MDERRRRSGAGALVFAFTLVFVIAGSVATAGAATLLPPGSVTATAASSSSIQIRWTDPAGSRETGYGVERGASNAGPFTQVAKTRRNTTSYTDTGLASGTTYFYRVRALGRRGAASSYSPVVSATTTRPADRTPPSVPTGLTATAPQCTRVDLSWSASTDTGGAGLFYYRVFRDGAFRTQVDAPTTSMSDASVTGAATYSYTVTAVDRNLNESAPSAARVVTTPPCAQNGTWAKGIGGPGVDIASANAVDRAGNVIVVGRFTGDTNVGGATLHSAGGFDAFVAKYASDGTHLWSKRFGGTDTFDMANGVAIDSAGNIIVVGSFSADVSFGGATLTSKGSADVFVAKFSANGDHLWSNRYGNTQYETANAVGIDTADNIIVGGTFQNGQRGVNFGGAVFTVPDQSYDGFVAKYSPAGLHLWSKQLHADYLARVNALATNAAGDIALAGYFDGDADAGDGTMTSAVQSGDGFVAVWTAAGNHRWSRHFGNNTNQDESRDVAFDSGANLVLVGEYGGSVDFGGRALSGDAAGNAFVAKYTSTGALSWVYGYGGKLDFDVAASVAIGPADALVVTGTFNASASTPANFGGAPFSGAGAADVFVAKYSASGAHGSSSPHGGAGADNANAVAVDTSGAPFVVGTFSGNGQFNGRTLTASGSLDSFVMKLAP